jgi:hypothetical protein
MTTNLYAPPKAQVADIVQAEAAPALWNPGAAASWSLLLSPAFGAILHPHNRAIPLFNRLCSFVLLLSWYFASGKPQVDFVKSRYGKQYPRKGWSQPLLIAFGILFGFGFFIGLIASVLLRRT